MKKTALKLLFTLFILFTSILKVQAIQFDVLVLPTDILSVCDNYFCFPETSEIVAEDVIQNLNTYKNISAIDLALVRDKLANNNELKTTTLNMLNQFQNTDKIDFQALKQISNAFGVKSVALISSYATTDKSQNRRDLWEMLEISNAFKISYPVTLTTNAVLTDTVNNIVMWSSKYQKEVSDSNGYFLAQNQAQAASHLEKIKLYSKSNIAQNISQNFHLRFFPKEVRTFTPSAKSQTEDTLEKHFVPNALDHLITPNMIKELDNGSLNTGSPSDDFIFEF